MGDMDYFRAALTKNYWVERKRTEKWYYVKRESDGSVVKRCIDFYQAERRAYYLDGRLEELEICDHCQLMNLYCSKYCKENGLE